MTKNLLKPADIVILLLAITLTSWLYHFFWFDNTQSGNADFLLIHIADKSAQYYSLNENKLIKIEGTIGESIIEIKQRKARFVHSPCRNQFCVLHGWLSHSGDITACLPNQMSISLHNSTQQTQYDAISGSP
ncbi:MAG: NusG domain II-containing protein [Thiotrichaceae bacterium]|nr:NusG domain II-containing protein [Thiotrichaceae bacterium]